MTLTIDAGLHPLVDGDPPAWASAWGEDRFGVYAAFTVDGVTQRMRWIPPGVFSMGSPRNEQRRYDQEGAAHLVTIAYGFWLFDTPCTQALWEAVTGDNPSQFKSPTRPVESVSFDDVGAFIDALNRRTNGLNLTLPSEAEWEYALRTDMEAASVADAMKISGEGNATSLHSIAKYSGKGDVNFDLDLGSESNAEHEKKEPRATAGTRGVGLKRTNPSGLYDMLGNVWEWCADTWHDDGDGWPTDGSAWIDADIGGEARGILRGGSWSIVVRGVRVAVLNLRGAGSRDVNNGFRCARIPSQSERERRAAAMRPARRG